MASEGYVSAGEARIRVSTYQTGKNLGRTGRRCTFALRRQETVFEDVLYPRGILEVSIGLLEWRDGMIGP